MFRKFFIALMILSLAFSCTKTEKSDSDKLVVYCYDAFASDWGTGPAVIPGFEEESGYNVELVACGDAVQMLNKLIAEKKNPKADVVIGLDSSLTSIVIRENILQQYVPENKENIKEDYIFDKDFYLTPYDYGYFSIVYDSSKIEAPTSFADLTDKKYEDKIIMIDPRTSSVGLGFMLWSIYLEEDNWLDYWSNLSGNLLTISDGWDRAYGLFTAGEAPMVLSYTTSPVYHIQYEDEYKYKAAIFSEGHYVQIEGAGIVAGAENLDGAKAFINYMLTNNFQDEVALTNYMYPVTKTAELPESFGELELPSKFFALDSLEIEKNNSQWISQWRAELIK